MWGFRAPDSDGLNTQMGGVGFINGLYPSNLAGDPKAHNASDGDPYERNFRSAGHSTMPQRQCSRNNHKGRKPSFVDLASGQVENAKSSSKMNSADKMDSD